MVHILRRVGTKERVIKPARSLARFGQAPPCPRTMPNWRDRVPTSNDVVEVLELRRHVGRKFGRAVPLNGSVIISSNLIETLDIPVIPGRARAPSNNLDTSRRFRIIY